MFTEEGPGVRPKIAKLSSGPVSEVPRWGMTHHRGRKVKPVAGALLLTLNSGPNLRELS